MWIYGFVIGILYLFFWFDAIGINCYQDVNLLQIYCKIITYIIELACPMCYNAFVFEEEVKYGDYYEI